MCGRASLTKIEKELEERFNAQFYAEDLERYNPLPSYNIAPTHFHPIIINTDQNHLQFFRWGLIPPWAKNASIGSKLINARIETILEKSSFKNAIHSRRCIIPFDGFYEWQKTSTGKIPHRILRKDKAIFTVAGIWEKWITGNKETVFSFTVITQKANSLLTDIHHRMPAILLPEQEKIWLDNSLNPTEILKMIHPYPNDLLDFYPVSNRVNKVSENDKDLLKEVPPEQKSQLELF